jgi:hypothetical protein
MVLTCHSPHRGGTDVCVDTVALREGCASGEQLASTKAKQYFTAPLKAQKPRRPPAPHTCTGSANGTWPPGRLGWLHEGHIRLSDPSQLIKVVDYAATTRPYAGLMPELHRRSEQTGITGRQI